MAHLSTAMSASRQRLSAHLSAREKARVWLPTHLPALERLRRFPAKTRTFHGLVAGIAGSRVAEHARAGMGAARTSRTQLFACFAGCVAGVAAQRALLWSKSPVFQRVFRNSAAFRTADRSKPPCFSRSSVHDAFRVLPHTESPQAQRREDTARLRGKRPSIGGRREAIFRKVKCREDIFHGDIDVPGCVDGYTAMACDKAADMEGRASGDSPCRALSAWWRRNRT